MLLTGSYYASSLAKEYATSGVSNVEMVGHADRRTRRDRRGVAEDTQEGEAMNPLQPTASLLCKLGSIVVHVDEMFSVTGHHFDKEALDGLLADTEVCEWLVAMAKTGMVPVRRTIEDLKLTARKR